MYIILEIHTYILKPIRYSELEYPWLTLKVMFNKQTMKMIGLSWTLIRNTKMCFGPLGIFYRQVQEGPKYLLTLSNIYFS